MEKSSRQITRRSFLKTTAAVAGAATIATSIGCTSGNEAPKDGAGEVPSTAVEEKVYANWCRGNCGAEKCCFETKVREGKVVSTRQRVVKTDGSVSIQPGCVRGPANPLRIYSSHRLLYPMLQTGERGSDNWERISWDEALSLMADKMQAAFDDYGAQSVGFVAGFSGNSGVLSTTSFTYANIPKARGKVGVGPERFFQKTGITLFTPGADVAQMYMQWTILQGVANSAEDIVNAKNVILWRNACDSARVSWSNVLDAKEKGANVIAIDPRYSNSAAHSDQWIPMRPGTDGAFILAVCNYIIENDLIDYDYLRNKSVAPMLIKEDGSYLRLSDMGLPMYKKVDPKSGKEIEVDTEVVYDEATGQFGSSFEVKDPAVTGSFDANGVGVRTVYDLTCETIAPFTVEFAVEECGLPTETIEDFARTYADGPSFIWGGWGLQHYQNSWRMYYGFALMASLTGNAQKPGASYGCPYGLATPAYKSPVLNKDVALTVDGAKINNMITLGNIPEIVNSGKWLGEEYPLRVLMVAGCNLIGSHIGYAAQTEALKKIDFVVVANEYLSDTVKLANLALPVCMTFEAEDYSTNAGNYMNQKAIEPIGESKSDFEIFVELAKAMGYDDLYDKDAEGYLREILDTEENIAVGVGYDDLHDKGVVVLDEITRAESVGVEYNATGRTQFYLESLVSNGNGDVGITLLDRLPYYEHAYEAYVDNPLREKYPLFGVSYHDNYAGHTMHAGVSWLNELRGLDGKDEPYTVIHEAAAAERGIDTGDTIRVFNDRGYVVTKALVSKGIREDTVCIPRGYESHELQDGHLQTLTSIEAKDRITNNDSHNDWLCQVEKI